MIGRLEFHAVFYLTSFSEGTYRSHVEMENEEVELEIADTAGEVWCFFIWLFVLYDASNYSRILIGSYLRRTDAQMTSFTNICFFIKNKKTNRFHFAVLCSSILSSHHILSLSVTITEQTHDNLRLFVKFCSVLGGLFNT